MFVFREFMRECGRPEIIVRECAFETIEDAKSCLNRNHSELYEQQRKWPGVWSSCLDEGHYTIDNDDGDFFRGCIKEV